MRTTERNTAWPMMGLASYYAVQPTAQIRTALDQLVANAAAWQAAGTSGAFEHDIQHPDPSERGDGPRGASPFMTSPLIDGLMDTWFLTADSRIPGVVTRAAEWYRDDARTSDGEAFQYLWAATTSTTCPTPATRPEHPDLARLRRRVPRLGRPQLARLRRRDGSTASTTTTADVRSSGRSRRGPS